MNRVFGDRKAVAILLLPTLIVYGLVMLAPVLWSLGLSLFSGNTLTGFTFVGFANFTKFVTDPNAIQSLWVSIIFAVFATASQITVGYLLALLYVFVLKNGSAFVRTAVFFPMVLPTVAVALLFRNFVSVGQNQGPVNDIINFFGGQSTDFLATTTGTMVVALVMTLWSSMGFYAVLLYTGLLDIPEEIIESARIDGAGGPRLVRHIVIPLSMPILLSSLIFSLNSTLKVFDSLLALNNGGPGTTTSPLTLYMYQTAFNYSEYGYGSTIALALTLLCLIFTIPIFRSSSRRAEN
jgi:raffinose/stachyose/melibiose transport system permease protein